MDKNIIKLSIKENGRKHLCSINITDDERKQIINWVNNVRIEENHLKVLQ
jgi:hypothetical protein